jgi:hypothetical protein
LQIPDGLTAERQKLEIVVLGFSSSSRRREQQEGGEEEGGFVCFYNGCWFLGDMRVETMGLLGENGGGYELALRLEEQNTWRAWLSERDHAAMLPYLASPGAWSKLMQSSSSSSLLALQLRVRALLFDKVAACLFLEHVGAAIVPNSLHPSCKSS